MQLPHETTQKNRGYCLFKRMHFHYFYFLPLLCSGLNLHGAMAKATEFWVYMYIGTKSIMFRSSETIISLLLKKSYHIIRSYILYMKFCPCTCPNTLNGCDVSLCTIYEFWLILWTPCIALTLSVYWISHLMTGTMLCVPYTLWKPPHDNQEYNTHLEFVSFWNSGLSQQWITTIMATRALWHISQHAWSRGWLEWTRNT